MNADTIRGIKEIKDNGYWQQGKTLGEGGWAAVNKFASGWYEYILWIDDSPEPIKINAKDGETAIKAFESMYRLDEVRHSIYRVETSYTQIK